MENPVVFENRKGEKLFGIVHVPDNKTSKNKRVGINLLNPGIKYRVAPNRLNVKLAKELCKNGYYVLRFDPSGIGDSEGEIQENMLIPDIGEKIQTGLFVFDTIDANSYFIKKFKINRLILVGNCGGAITSLLTSAKDERVCSLCLIDIPVNLRTSKMTFADKVKEGGQRSNWLYDEYVKRIFDKKSWYRFITLQTDFKALRKVLKMKVHKKIGRKKEVCEESQYLEILCAEKKLNKLFYESFQKFTLNKKPILFLVAENDPGAEIFEHFFINLYLKKKYQNISYKNFVDYVIVKNASHVYALQESQEFLLNNICSWINSRES